MFVARTVFEILSGASKFAEIFRIPGIATRCTQVAFVSKLIGVFLFVLPNLAFSQPGDPLPLDREALDAAKAKSVVPARAMLQLKAIQLAAVAGDEGAVFADSIHGRLSRGELEEMLYGVLGGSRQAFRHQRRDAIQRYVDRIDSICQLDEEQEAKISQAIDIEISRTETLVTTLLAEIQDNTPPSQKQKIYSKAFLHLRDLQIHQSLEKDSLWKKVLHASLRPEQSQLVDADDAAIEAKRIEGVHLRLLLLAQRKMGLMKEDRAALKAFLDRPANSKLASLQELKRALDALPTEERKQVMSDKHYSQWK